MAASGVTLANRRLILLTVLSMIASLLLVNIAAPRAQAAGETVDFVGAASTPGEGDGSVTVQLILKQSVQELTTAVVDVAVTVTGGSATGGAVDYTYTSPTTFTFPIGSQQDDTLDVVIPIAQDTLVEGPETIDLSLNVTAGGSNGSQTTHTVTITDDDSATVAFSAATSSAGEGTTPHTIPVTLSIPGGGSLATAVVVDITDLGTGTATGTGTDYTLSTTQVTFVVGSVNGAAQNVSLAINNDTNHEPDETVNLSLAINSGPAAASGQNTHTHTITDNDNVTIAFSNPSSSAGEGTTPHTIPVALTVPGGGTLASTVVVDITDLGTGTATGTGTDYTLTTTQVTFIAGSVNGATQNVSLAINNDTLTEPSETVNLSLAVNSGPATASGQTTHAHTITDNDSATVAFSAATSSAGEGTTPHTIPVTLSIPGGGSLATAVVVDITDLGTGTATGTGTDYTLSTTQVTFPISSINGATQNVSLAINNDTNHEPDETVNLSLAVNSGPATASGQTTHAHTITDNDPVTIAFTNATSSASEGTTPHTISVTMTVPGGGTLASDVVVDITDLGTGTATGTGTDYTLSTTQVTFTAGSSGGTQNVSLAINNDTNHEPDETVNLSLAINSGPGTATGQTTHTHTITDNDNVTIAFTNASSNAPEETTPHTITVTMTVPGGGTLAAPVVVDITDLPAGTATGADYSLTTTQVSFTAGSVTGATQNVNIAITNDGLMESNETINLSLAINSGPGTATGQTAHEVTIIDDESRNITVIRSGASTVVSESGTTDTFGVRLTQAPLSGTVTVDLTKTAESDEFNISPTQITFNSGTWTTPQDITVTPVDDDIIDGDRAGQVTLSASGGGYDAVTGTESVTITDDDVAGATIVESSGSTAVVEGGPGDTYTVVLTAKPGSNVTVSFGYDNTELGVSPTSLTFTPTNWSSAQTVTVTGVDDGIDELEEMHTITNTLSSSDTNFNGLSAASVVVTVGDSDALIVTIDGPTVGAPGLPATFTATVNAGGTGTITYTWTAILDGKQFASGDKSTFTFTPTAADSAIVSVQVGDNQNQNPLEFLPFTVLNDSGNNVFTADIVWLAEEGITKGCNPPTNNEFCPNANVTRAQMAAFLVRFLGLSDDGGGNTFTDDNGSIFEGDIARLAAAGITKGCNPPANTNFCPNANVTRGQMAAFLKRANAILNP